MHQELKGFREQQVPDPRVLQELKELRVRQVLLVFRVHKGVKAQLVLRALRVLQVHLSI